MRWSACAAFVSLVLACSTLLAQSVSDEHRLKAAFLFRFPEFVEWPTAAWEGRPAVQVCVAAPNAYHTALTEVFADQVLGGRPFMLRPVTDDAAIGTCHVLFISAPSTSGRLLLRRAQRQAILTVGDDPRFLDDGGVVQLRVVESRIRFEISVTAAQEAGLKLSSQLLRLALNVRGAPQ